MGYTKTGTPPRSRRCQDRIEQFLGRDPLLNFHIASTYRHEPSRIIGMAESGEALVGVAIARAGTAKDAPLVRLDAIGPVALRRLVATLRPKLTRLLLHRPWLAEALERDLGPLRVRFSTEIYNTDDDFRVTVPDPRIRELRQVDLAPLLARSHDWMLDVLANHLARGWQAFGILDDGALIAQACCSYPTGDLEEISHVYSAPEYRGQGLASASVRAAIAAVGARGHHALYFCRTANLASRRVAERCGLRHLSTMHEVAVTG